jgi:glycosyltransferase involved in cell wall biosynthesis
VVERTPAELAQTEVDLVILQQPHHRHLATAWLGRRPGHDLPAVYVEHDPPAGPPGGTRHPASDWPGVTVAHVTHFNALMWDTGNRPTRVIEHGVVDPGHLYTGELARAAVVVNDPVRRGRTTGTDLLARFDQLAGVDLFGMRSEALGGRDLPQNPLHPEMARRRVYLHLTRWTSLGLSLIEAMHLGMPVVALGTTEAPEAVPPEAGVVSNRLDRLEAALRTFMADPDLAAAMGATARHCARTRFGLERFVDDWDRLLKEVAWC